MARGVVGIDDGVIPVAEFEGAGGDVETFFFRVQEEEVVGVKGGGG